MTESKKPARTISQQQTVRKDRTPYVELEGDVAKGPVVVACKEPGCGVTVADSTVRRLEHRPDGSHTAITKVRR